MVSSPLTYFIAHAGGDTERARELRNLLHPDIPVFLDACDLAPGDKWDVELPRRQREARATVALLTQSVDPAYYLKEEIANAVAAHRRDPAAHRLIPVYLDGLPREPWDTPYGVRGLHALDAAALGMAGVAAELRRLAPALQHGAALPAPEPPPPVDRLALFEALNRLLGAQFDEILFRVAAPSHQLAPAGQPLVRRALDLVQWSEQGGPTRMSDLAKAIRHAAPGLLP